MPLSDFDNLLGDLATAFGTIARILPSGAEIEGRFFIDPFDVSQSPAENGVNVTQTWFYYEPKKQVVQPQPVPKLHDLLLIRDREYKIIKIDRDDLGEHALQLLLTGPP